jgi:hypothetical protein
VPTTKAELEAEAKAVAEAKLKTEAEAAEKREAEGRRFCADEPVDFSGHWNRTSIQGFDESRFSG